MPPPCTISNLERLGVALLVAVALAGAAPTLAGTVASTNGPPAPGRTAPPMDPTRELVSTPDSGAVLVVDPDDDDAYGSVQGAVDAAADGDTVEVRPGTYQVTLTVAKNVTLVAPDGATFDGSTLSDRATAVTIPAESGAEPTVAGFTVTGYDVGLDATGTAGAWTVRDTTFRDIRIAGVDPGIGVAAARTAGAWAIRNSTFVNVGDAVDVEQSTGAWAVSNSTFRSNGYGIDASHSEGDWTVRNSTFHWNRDGIETWYSAGAWTIHDSVFRDNRDGVYTSHSTSAWEIHDTTFRNNTYRAVDGSSAEGDWGIYDSVFLDNTLAVDATGAGGDWEIHGSTFVGSEKSAIFAFGAPTVGDARRNWWGNASGEDVDDCYGQVDCSDHLTEPPVDRPVFVERSDTERWNTTATVSTITPDSPTVTPGDSGLPGSTLIVSSILIVGIPGGLVLGVIVLLRREGHI